MAEWPGKVAVPGKVTRAGTAARHAPAAAPAALQADRQVQDGAALLRHVSAAVQAGSQAAVAQDGRTLRHASAVRRNDREPVQATGAQFRWGLRHASEELRNDRAVVLAAVAKWPRALPNVSEERQNDRVAAAAAAAARDDGILDSVPEVLKAGSKVAICLVRTFCCLEYTSIIGIFALCCRRCEHTVCECLSAALLFALPALQAAAMARWAATWSQRCIGRPLWSASVLPGRSKRADWSSRWVWETQRGARRRRRRWG